MRFSKVLVPVHGAEVDDEAVRLACQVTKPFQGKVFVLYIIEVNRGLPLDAEVKAETEKAERVLDHIVRLGREEGMEIEAELLQAREAGPAVVDEVVERGADLVILGQAYKRHFGTFSLRTTASYLLKNVPCRVWICRESIPPRNWG